MFREAAGRAMTSPLFFITGWFFADFLVYVIQYQKIREQVLTQHSYLCYIKCLVTEFSKSR
jgi:hypothetical protein